MKILMIAPEPIFEPRGTPLSVVGRLKAFSDMGYKVDLLTYSIGEDVDLPGIRILRIPRVPGINNIKIGPSFKKIPLDFFLLIKSIFQINKQDYDLVHTHEEAGFWGIILSRIYRKPHVYDMHSSLPQQLKNFQFTESKFLISIFKSIEHWVLKYSSRVITICPDLFEYVKEIFPKNGSVLIENVIDYSMIFGEIDLSSKIRDDLDLADKKVILYTGTFEPYQGLDLLIESAEKVIAEHKDIVFVLVGGRPDQVLYYQESAARKGMGDYFIFTGQVLPQQVNSYIRCADILLSPRTKGTNTPLKIYAYLRSGVPVVATRLLTHTQVLNDDISILCDPNPNDYGAGISSLLNDTFLCRRIGENAVITAGESYNYSVYRKKLKKVVAQAEQAGG